VAPTDERVRGFAGGRDPGLAALYFQYGRYLLIASSRTGSQPANLQGIWNDSMSPPWGSKYTININTQMNYWPALSTNLAETMDPLMAMVSDLTVTGARTARTMYGAGGWVAHHNTDLWRATAPIDGPQWGMWPAGGAWLTLALWDRYEYTGDRTYLRTIYPMLKGAAQFFLDTLVEEPSRRWLVTSPSLSPENPHPFGTSLVMGPTMDQQILRELFTSATKAPVNCGSGSRTGTCRHRSGTTATYRISSDSFRGTTSTLVARRTWRPPFGAPWSFAAIRPPAGRRRGESIYGRDWVMAIAPTTS
jgi:alpha-L-fucosidase 2